MSPGLPSGKKSSRSSRGSATEEWKWQDVSRLSPDTWPSRSCSMHTSEYGGLSGLHWSTRSSGISCTKVEGFVKKKIKEMEENSILPQLGEGGKETKKHLLYIKDTIQLGNRKSEHSRHNSEQETTTKDSKM